LKGDCEIQSFVMVEELLLLLTSRNFRSLWRPGGDWHGGDV